MFDSPTHPSAGCCSKYCEKAVLTATRDLRTMDSARTKYSQAEQ